MLRFVNRQLYLLSQINRYTSHEHSLLKQIYTYPYNDHYLGYLLVDHQSKSILSIDPGDHETALNNINMLRLQFGYNFTHIFQTHGNSRHTSSSRFFKNRFDGVSVYAGNSQQDTNCFYTHLANDLCPIIIGELSICFLATPGHTKDSHTIAVTHISNDSNLVPILFTGDTLLVCSVGDVQDYDDLNKSLQRLRGFPAETLIFPGHRMRQENLLLTKTIDPNNPILAIKLNAIEEATKQQNYPIMVPTSMMEERFLNLYLRIGDQAIQKQIQEKNDIKCLQKLKLIEKTFFS